MSSWVNETMAGKLAEGGSALLGEILPSWIECGRCLLHPGGNEQSHTGKTCGEQHSVRATSGMGTQVEPGVCTASNIQ